MFWPYNGKSSQIVVQLLAVLNVSTGGHDKDSHFLERIYFPKDVPKNNTIIHVAVKQDMVVLCCVDVLLCHIWFLSFLKRKTALYNFLPTS